MAAPTEYGGAESRLGDMDFSTFVISLGSSVLSQLNRGGEHYDLELAHQTIDILAMLEQKTAGNLTPAESDLLRGILYQTRLAWAEAKADAAQSGAKPAG